MSLLQTADPNLKKFVEVSRNDAKKSQAIQQRYGNIVGKTEYSTIKLEGAEFPVDVVVG